jgi:hypothetical protein
MGDVHEFEPLVLSEVVVCDPETHFHVTVSPSVMVVLAGVKTKFETSTV